jgi:hypothetical protein
MTQHPLLWDGAKGQIPGGRETVRVLLMGIRLAWGVDERWPRLFSIDESTIDVTRILILTPRLAAMKGHSKLYFSSSVVDSIWAH